MEEKEKLYCPKCANESGDKFRSDLTQVECEFVCQEVTENGVFINFYRCPRCHKLWRVAKL